ncbi:unnamed protein product [Leptidea sinapis]|uniref:C2H2-type domain-containing protein n=1 Tax=Leptidea sinapis TaxID=189913 RepID=A0A5E4QTM3_9NEOP|nr:unnamed protein product [Leptidea sinapis]
MENGDTKLEITVEAEIKRKTGKKIVSAGSKEIASNRPTDVKLNMINGQAKYVVNQNIKEGTRNNSKSNPTKMAASLQLLKKINMKERNCILSEHIYEKISKTEDSFHTSNKETQNQSINPNNVDNSHTPEQGHSCIICGESCTCSTFLERHNNTDKKPYSCNICSKSFTNPVSLKRHTRSHSHEKPYSCNVCGKGFTVSCNLKNHKNAHSEEIPYSCNICGKTFLYPNGLKEHKTIHNIICKDIIEHIQMRSRIDVMVALNLKQK